MSRDAFQLSSNGFRFSTCFRRVDEFLSASPRDAWKIRLITALHGAGTERGGSRGRRKIHFTLADRLFSTEGGEGEGLNGKLILARANYPLPIGTIENLNVVFKLARVFFFLAGSRNKLIFDANRGR